MMKQNEHNKGSGNVILSWKGEGRDSLGRMYELKHRDIAKTNKKQHTQKIKRALQLK